MGPRKKGTPARTFGRDPLPVDPISGKFLNFGGFSEVEIIIMTVVEEHYDYVICEDDRNKQQRVAKPWHLRRKPFLETVDGIDYTWSTVGQRDADDGSEQETQIITPSYIVGEELICFRVRGMKFSLESDDQSQEYRIIWQEFNTAGRCWAVSS
jgi:hypothetical protein